MCVGFGALTATGDVRAGIVGDEGQHLDVYLFTLSAAHVAVCHEVVAVGFQRPHKPGGGHDHEEIAVLVMKHVGTVDGDGRVGYAAMNDHAEGVGLLVEVLMLDGDLELGGVALLYDSVFIHLLFGGFVGWGLLGAAMVLRRTERLNGDAERFELEVDGAVGNDGEVGRLGGAAVEVAVIHEQLPGL